MENSRFPLRNPAPHLVAEDVSLPSSQRLEPEERKQRPSDFGAGENSRFLLHCGDLTYLGLYLAIQRPDPLTL